MDGEPGVHSARFLGADAAYPERFAEISAAPRRRARRGAHRALRLRALAVADGDASAVRDRGTIEGADRRRAGRATAASATTRSSISPQLGCTLAEAGDAKAAVSHRGRAFAALARWLDDLG